MASDYRTLLQRFRESRADLENSKRERHTTYFEYEEDGLFTDGSADQVWRYFAVPTGPGNPIYTDAAGPAGSVSLGTPLEKLFTELGARTFAKVSGTSKIGVEDREIHMLVVDYRGPVGLDEDLPWRQEAYLSEVLDYYVPKRAVFVGVRLRRVEKVEYNDQETGIADGVKKAFGSAKEIVAEKSGLSKPDLSAYEADEQLVLQLAYQVARLEPITPEQKQQLSAWYSDGRAIDERMDDRSDHVYLPDRGMRWELAQVTSVPLRAEAAPNFSWIQTALSSQSPANVVSIRGRIIPPETARHDLKQNRRRVTQQIRETLETADGEVYDEQELVQLAEQYEQFLENSGTAVLSDVSAVLARRIDGQQTTYVDTLRSQHGIIAERLINDQFRAVCETLPCSPVRLGGKRLQKGVTTSFLSYTGAQMFTEIGDTKGAFLGTTQTSDQPVFLDMGRAAGENQAPVNALIGDSGSGKTFLAQLWLIQLVNLGIPFTFVNPKAGGALLQLQEYLKGTLEVANLSDSTDQQGLFDPFTYITERDVAARMAADHIISVLGGSLGPERTQIVREGFQTAALDPNVACVGHALQYVTDQQSKDLIRRQIETSAAFALGASMVPRAVDQSTSKFRLIEFGDDIGLDANVETDPLRHLSALAAIRLVTRASMSQLSRLGGGGVLFIDEAHNIVATDGGKRMLDVIGRESRSLNVNSVLITQKFTDLTGLESFFARVFCLGLDDPDEAARGIRLCGREATPARVKWLTEEAKPVRVKGEQQPALCIHRDMDGRVGSMRIGPVTEEVYAAITTNPEDLEKLREAKQIAQVQAQQQAQQEQAAATQAAEEARVAAAREAASAAALRRHQAQTFPTIQPGAPQTPASPTAAQQGQLTPEQALRERAQRQQQRPS